jgi:serine/threonine protein kinase
VKLLTCFETNSFFCLCFEYCKGGTLLELVTRKKHLSEFEARFYITELLLAIDALHWKNIIYWDLKPENIFLDKKGHLKLGDFGLCKWMQSINCLTYSFCGSKEFFAPEMILKQGHNISLDYYQVGCILYWMLFGLPPFYSKNEQILLSNITNY